MNTNDLAIHQILAHATQLEGQSLGWLHQVFSVQSLEKGWVGKTIEEFLGVLPENRQLCGADFPHLGLEVKTIPLNEALKAKESTFVSQLPSDPEPFLRWEDSSVYQKLCCVLWIPYLVHRTHWEWGKILTPFVWVPDHADQQQLREDWETIIERVCIGQMDQLHAGYGKYLHIRPKGENRTSCAYARNEIGERKKIPRKAFYLRTLFTSTIMTRQYYHVSENLNRSCQFLAKSSGGADSRN